MKDTGLTSQETKLIEDILVTYGFVVTFEQVVSLRGGKSRQQVKNRVSRMVKKGWLLRIKKGLYAVCDISSRGSLPFSEYVVSGLLVPESYISFEGALQHHGMYNQLLGTMRSVSLKQYKDSKVGAMEYQFVKTQEKYFYGWDVVWFGAQEAKMAFPEKALIDLVQFHRNTYTVDLVIEVLVEYGESLDLKRLLGYLELAPVTVQRIFGFLFENLGLQFQADMVEEMIGGRASRSRITSESSIFSSRWRLYFDDYFVKYVSVPEYIAA